MYFFPTVLTFRPTLVSETLLVNTTNTITRDSFNFGSFKSKRLVCGSACNAMRKNRQDSEACNSFYFSPDGTECHLLFVDLVDALWYSNEDKREVYIDAKIN